MHDNHLIKAALFRAHYRGGKEADTIIGGFTRQYVHTLSMQELDSLNQLLTFDDHQIIAWIEYPDAKPEQFSGSLLQKMHDYAVNIMMGGHLFAENSPQGF